jgi:hypothetical protein
MTSHAAALIKVADDQIKHLGRRSQDLKQDTRVSVYTFADDVRNEVFDQDVLRTPSIKGLYAVRGNTALIDATLQSQKDLARTAQMYDDHAFLTFVLTDGQNNINSHRARDLRDQLRLQPDNWTVACLVPDARSRNDAQAFGFAPENIAIWDATGRNGVEDAGQVIRTATENFMTGRARGVVGTKTLFSTGVEAVNAATVQSTLTPLDPAAYDVIPVDRDDYIRPFVESRGLRYTIGSGYYELTKRETIGNRKQIAIREKRGARRVFTGASARDLLGLGGDDVRVSPDYNPDYSIHVQSTSVNRRLVAGTDLLVLR